MSGNVFMENEEPAHNADMDMLSSRIVYMCYISLLSWLLQPGLKTFINIVLQHIYICNFKIIYLYECVRLWKRCMINILKPEAINSMLALKCNLIIILYFASALSMNMLMAYSQHFTHYYPSRPWWFYIYIFFLRICS